MPEIVTGKINIMSWFREKFRVHSWQTVKRLKKIGLPIRYLNHVPFIICLEVITWAVKNDDLTKENRKLAKKLTS